MSVQALLDKIVAVVLAYKPKRNKKAKQRRKPKQIVKKVIPLIILMCLSTLISLSALSGVKPPEEGIANQTTQNSSQRAQRKVNPQTTTIENSPTKQNFTQNNYQEPKEKTSNWNDAFAPQTLPSWILALVGIAGIFVAIGTMVFIAIQAVAGKRAAEAALLNAKAVVNSERAWLMVVPINASLWNKDIAFRETPSVNIQFKNWGKTPAFIVEYCYRFVSMTKEEFTNPLRYGEPLILPDGEPIPPQELSIRFNREWEAGRKLTDDEFKAIAARELVLLLYGFIRYRTIFYRDTKELGETRFCFRYIYKRNATDKWVDFDNWGYEISHEGANEHT